MEGDVEHPGIVVEHVLGPVPVVHVPVQDQDPLQSMLLHCVLGGDRHIVHHTEAPARVSLADEDDTS